MHTKEIALLGMAMQALMEAGLTDKVKEIIDYMATIDKQPNDKDK